MAPASKRIRDLNDAFRKAGPASDWLVTSGIRGLAPTAIATAIRKVVAFDSFTPGNDPHGEHDFGSFRLAGENVYWKIDYYDLECVYGSEDPANPEITRRVMTILLASEY